MRTWFRAVVFASLMSVVPSCAHQNPPPAVEVLDYSKDTHGDDSPGADVSRDDRDETAGPTQMDRVEGGYELKNRRIRAVISDKTGNLIYWGPADGRRNLLLRDGMTASLAGVTPASFTEGYIEKRDDQTWQFLGEDASRIGWRKIYCLEGSSLLVSILMQNNSGQPIHSRVQLSAEFASLKVGTHTADDFEATGAYGTVRVRAFNERHDAQAVPSLPVIVIGDELDWKPQERQSFTTEWRLDLAAAATPGGGM